MILNGALHDGTLQNGTLQNGTLHNGTLQNGTWFKTVHGTKRYVVQHGTWYKTVRYKTVRLQNGNLYKTVTVTMGKEDVCSNLTLDIIRQTQQNSNNAWISWACALTNLTHDMVMHTQLNST